MNVFLSLLSLSAAVCVCSGAAVDPDDKYYKVKGNVNIDEVLNSERLLTNYFNCLIEKGQCTPHAFQLRRILPEALSGKCTKCSPDQKEAAAKTIKFLTVKKPDMWKELSAKYDPDGTYRTKAKSDPELTKYNIQV